MADRITPAIERVRASLAAGQRVDGNGPLAPGAAERLEKELDNSPAEHFAFQEAQARAFALGALSQPEAQVIYAALGEVPSADGWASGTDLATKVIVTQVMQEILSAFRKAGILLAGMS